MSSALQRIFKGPDGYSLKNDKWIRYMCEEHEMISPFVSKLVTSELNIEYPEDDVEHGPKPIVSYGLSSYGYDIRLSPEEYHTFTNAYFGYSKDGHEPSIIDPLDFDIDHLQPIYDEPYLVLPPHGFALAKSVEYFKIPENVLAIFLGKSTYARCGINVNVTPAEPDWEGQLTLEIANMTPQFVKVHGNQGISQVIFFEGERPEVTYGDRKGKYQHQKGVTFPRVKHNS